MKRELEALLFATDSPLTSARLKKIFAEVDGKELRAAIQELQEEYDQAEHAFTIIEFGGGWQIATRPEYSPLVEKLLKTRRFTRLTKAGLEVLAIIAYRQPLTRLDIDEIRGVNSSGAISTLTERNLITVVGRSETVGNPLLYGTTREFLNHLGLRGLSQLPELPDIEVVMENKDELKEFASRVGREVTAEDLEEYFAAPETENPSGLEEEDLPAPLAALVVEPDADDPGTEEADESAPEEETEAAMAMNESEDSINRPRKTMAPADGTMRLNRYLARAGYGSRRSTEELITAGRVAINGEAVKDMGRRVHPGSDTVTVDGSPAVLPDDFRVYAFNKPHGVVSTLKSQGGQPTLLPYRTQSDLQERFMPVGRLDSETTGLLLWTDDGGLNQALCRPMSGMWKTYQVELDMPPSDADVLTLTTGKIELDGRHCLPCKLELDPGRTTCHWVMSLHEGRRRQIRRMFKEVGRKVVKLHRSSIGPVHLGKLRPGDFRRLNPTEVASLRAMMEQS